MAGYDWRLKQDGPRGSMLRLVLEEMTAMKRVVLVLFKVRKNKDEYSY